MGIKMKKEIAAAFSLLLSCSTAFAAVGQQINPIEGTWATKEACEWKKKFNSDPSSPSPDELFDYMYLTEKGIEGYEWGCSFVKSFDGDYGETVNIASCSAEGDAWPQMMITRKAGKDGWDVSILNAKNEPESVNFPTRCD